MEKVDREVNVIVDLDAEKGIPPKQGRSNSFRVIIRPAANTKTIDMSHVKAYLSGQLKEINPAVIDAISKANFVYSRYRLLNSLDFLDHLLREGPSKSLISIKKSYFSRIYDKKSNLGGGVDAMRGVYQSLRMAEVSIVLGLMTSLNIFLGSETGC